MIKQLPMSLFAGIVPPVVAHPVDFHLPLRFVPVVISSFLLQDRTVVGATVEFDDGSEFLAKAKSSRQIESFPGMDILFFADDIVIDLTPRQRAFYAEHLDCLYGASLLPNVEMDGHVYPCIQVAGRKIVVRYSNNPVTILVMDRVINEALDAAFSKSITELVR